MEANNGTSEARSTPEPSENVTPAASVAEGAGGSLGPQAPNSKKRAYPGTITAPATNASDDRPPRDLSRINYPKKRVSVACELCRSRKTRCDAKKPSCSFCSQTGVPCNYRTTVISTNQAPKYVNVAILPINPAVDFESTRSLYGMIID